jgi:hypothetical protein
MKTLKPILVFFFIFSFQLLPQSLSIGIGSGLNFISGTNYYTDNFGRLGKYEDINGTTTNLEGMDLSNELQFQICGKYSFEKSPFILSTGFNYFPMRGNEQMDVYDFVLMTEVSKDVTTKMDIWSFQIGANYFLEFYSIKPFMSVSLSANYFDDVYIELAETDYMSEFRSYKNGMRYGYSLGLGIAYDVFSNYAFELSSSYNSFNSLHKREGEVLLNSINILFNIYYKII